VSNNPPISFDAKAKSAGNPATGGYPYSLKGSDLDKNFTFATEDFDTTDFVVTTGLGAGGHQNRKVALAVSIEAGTATGQVAVWNGELWSPSSSPPKSGTYVLGAVNGAIRWISTEEC
jgi:hypothetical protein